MPRGTDDGRRRSRARACSASSTDPLDWGVVKSQARAHEVTPLIAPALASAGGVPEAGPTWATLSTRATLVRNLSLADELLSILGVLEDGGIDAMPVKGLAVAERYYGSLALRPSADIDVLIHPR